MITLLFFYLAGVIIAAMIISYDNWLIKQYPCGDIKYPYKWALESWYYIYVYLKCNYW